MPMWHLVPLPSTNFISPPDGEEKASLDSILITHLGGETTTIMLTRSHVHTSHITHVGGETTTIMLTYTHHSCGQRNYNNNANSIACTHITHVGGETTTIMLTYTHHTCGRRNYNNNANLHTSLMWAEKLQQ